MEMEKDIINNYRKTLALQNLRELAISLALQISVSECCQLLSKVEVTLPSGRKSRIKCYSVNEPEHLLKARNLYVQRYISLAYVSKARSLLRRYGIPECYLQLAFLIARGIIKL